MQQEAELTFPPLIEGIITGHADRWNEACDYLHEYFVSQNNLSHTFFTLHAVDCDQNENRLTSADVVAILALDQAKIGKARKAVMADADGSIAELLHQIPNDIDLVDAHDDILGGEAPLAQLIDLLAQRFGLPDKAINVILARKRPRLVPLMLTPQARALQAEGSLLELMRALASRLREDDGRLAYQLYYLNSSANIWEGLSQVQLLSVLLYREYRIIRQAEKEQKQAEKARKKAAKAEKKKQKALKAARKREKKLKKLEDKRAAQVATQKERQQLKKLREQIAKTSPISTDAFKLREN